MPELAEVEFYRKRWHRAAEGRVVRRVRLRPDSRVFRDARPRQIERALTNSRLASSETAGKQMVFRFRPNAWLGIHLGMTGQLLVQPLPCSPSPHDHLVLELENAALVFRDPRMFGRVRFSTGEQAPSWWASIAPPVLSPAFTRDAVADFLRRRSRSPIKAVLLMQERFPGIGNWMADEILWRAGIHPAEPAASLTPEEVRRLWTEVRRVCRMALDAIAGRGKSPPDHLNVGIPDSWLFRHRWEPGGRCPRTGQLLARAQIGGRTTCWSPARQRRKAEGLKG